MYKCIHFLTLQEIPFHSFGITKAYFHGKVRVGGYVGATEYWVPPKMAQVKKRFESQFLE